MKTGYVIYDCEWKDIARQDWPTAGTVYVCKRMKPSVGAGMWSVFVMGDGTLKGDTMCFGIFWRVGIAQLFAEALEREMEKVEAGEVNAYGLDVADPKKQCDEKPMKFGGTGLCQIHVVAACKDPRCAADYPNPDAHQTHPKGLK